MWYGQHRTKSLLDTRTASVSMCSQAPSTTFGNGEPTFIGIPPGVRNSQQYPRTRWLGDNSLQSTREQRRVVQKWATLGLLMFSARIQHPALPVAQYCTALRRGALVRGYTLEYPLHCMPFIVPQKGKYQTSSLSCLYTRSKVSESKSIPKTIGRPAIGYFQIPPVRGVVRTQSLCTRAIAVLVKVHRCGSPSASAHKDHDRLGHDRTLKCCAEEILDTESTRDFRRVCTYRTDNKVVPSNKHFSSSLRDCSHNPLFAVFKVPSAPRVSPKVGLLRHSIVLNTTAIGRGSCAAAQRKSATRNQA